jgi:hypothetical protein
MGAWDHTFHDEKDALGESEIYRSNQIRRVDAGRKIARTRIFRITGG